MLDRLSGVFVFAEACCWYVAHRCLFCERWLCFTQEDQCEACFESNAWLCECGHHEESGLHCSLCRREPPWGCDCGMCREPYDDEMVAMWADYPGELLADDIDFQDDASERSQR